MTTKIDLDELGRKAAAASNAAISDHPWRVYRCRFADDGLACGIKDEPFVSEVEDAYQIGIVIDTNRDECQHAIAVEDAEHIAANSPPVTLALIARIRELEQLETRPLLEVVKRQREQLEAAERISRDRLEQNERMCREIERLYARVAELEQGVVLP